MNQRNQRYRITSDRHVHTLLSFDGKEKHHTFLDNALKHGFQSIGFCEHVELDERYRFGVHPPPDDRIEKLKQIRKQYAGRIEVLFGLEVSYLPVLEDKIRNCINNSDFWDYIIGSVHIIEINGSIYDMTSSEDAAYVFRTFPLEQIAENYLQTSQNLAASGLFSILGHVDMIKRYCPVEKLSELHKVFDAGNAFAPVFKAALENEMMIEINASGLRHQHRELYPGEETVSVWKKTGGSTCCYSSDSHAPDHFGLGVSEVEKILEQYDLTCS